MKPVSRWKRMMLLGATVLLGLSVAGVAYQASAATSVDLNLSVGASSFIGRDGDTVRLRYTGTVLNESTTTSKSFHIQVITSRQATIWIGEANFTGSTICTRGTACSHAFTRRVRARTAETFGLEVTGPPGTIATITVQPPDGTADTDPADNERSLRTPTTTDLLLQQNSLMDLTPYNMGMPYAYTMRVYQRGPAAIAGIRVRVEADEPVEIRFDDWLKSGRWDGSVCVDATVCEFTQRSGEWHQLFPPYPDGNRYAFANFGIKADPGVTLTIRAIPVGGYEEATEADNVVETVFDPA